jgi:hypothetical protein
MIGGIERLGVLPVLAALVVQFKDMRWPPPHPSWMQIALFGGLMAFYWLCMLMLRALPARALRRSPKEGAGAARSGPPSPCSVHVLPPEVGTSCSKNLRGAKCAAINEPPPC